MSSIGIVDTPPRAAWLLCAAAVAGTLVAIVNYVMPDNGIAGTGGALLVIGSSALAAGLGAALARGATGRMRCASLVAALVLVAGTAFAAWLLEAPTLVAAMAVAGFGLLWHFVRGTPARS
jgi:hypothetical protein